MEQQDNTAVNLEPLDGQEAPPDKTVRRRKNKNLENKMLIELIVNLVIAIFIFACCLNVYSFGIIGEIIYCLLNGTFGNARFFFPFYLVWLSIHDFYNGKKNGMFEKLYILILAILNMGFFKMNGYNGGVIGDGVFDFFCVLLSKWGYLALVAGLDVYPGYKVKQTIDKFYGKISKEENRRKAANFINNVKIMKLPKDNKKLQSILDLYQINAKVVGKIDSFAVVRYLIELNDRTKIQDIARYKNEIALHLDAPDVVFGRQDGKVFIEIQKAERKNSLFMDLIRSERFKNSKPLEIAIGTDIGAGKDLYEDIKDFPHCLIAGGSGSGKSVRIETFVLNVALKNSPEEVNILAVDTKRVSINSLRNLPHLLSDILKDDDEIINAFNWLVDEMERRYALMERDGCRRFPTLLVVVDEVDDIFSTLKHDIETPITRISKKGRECGIHLIFGTQRPSKDLITGHIQNNFLTRICLRVADVEESKRVINSPKGVKLLGKGDTYFKSPTTSLKRLQGYYISRNEAENLVNGLCDRYETLNRIDFRNSNPADETGVISNECNLVYFQREKAEQADEEKALCEGYETLNRIDFKNSNPDDGAGAVSNECNLVYIQQEKGEQAEEKKAPIPEKKRLDKNIAIAARKSILENNKQINMSFVRTACKVGRGKAMAILDEMERLSFIQRSGIERKPDEVIITLEELDCYKEI